MSQSVGTITLDLGLNSKGIDSQIQSVGKQINSKMTSQLSGLGDMAKKIGATIAGAFAIKKTIDFGKQCIELGSDLAEVQNVVDVAFPKMSGTIDKFAKNAAAQFGLSETMAKRYAGTFGSMSKAFGFSEKEAAEMSTTLTGLSGDVASFYNISQDEAYTKLKSVFTGETESLKDLGVVMTQTALDQFALQNGFGKTTAKMTEQEKVALRFAFVQKQLTDASGDFARTSDSWANQVRLLSLQFDSLKASIGQGLINIFAPVLKLINTLLGKLSVLANAFKSFTEMLTGKKSENTAMADTSNDLANVQDNASGASDSMNDLTKSTKKASKAARGLANFDELNVLQQPDSENGTGSGKGNGGISSGTLTGNTAKVLEPLDRKLTKIQKKFKELSKLFTKGFKVGLGDTKVFDSIKQNLTDIKRLFKELFTDQTVLKSADNFLKTFAYSVGKTLGSIVSIGATIADNLTGGFSLFLKNNKGRIQNHIITLFDVAGQIAKMAGDWWEAVANVFSVWRSKDGKKITESIMTIFTEVIMMIQKNFIRNIKDTLNLLTKPFISNQKRIKQSALNTLHPISKTLEGIKNAIKLLGDTFDKTYTKHIEPLMNSISDGFSRIFKVLIEGYNKYVVPVLNELATKFNTVIKKKIQPMILKIGNAIGKISDLIKVLWKDILQPYVEWLSKYVMPILSWFIKKIGSSLLKNLSNAADAIKFIAGIVGDTATVFKRMIELGKDAFDFIGKLIKDIGSGNFDFKATFSAVRKKSFDVAKEAWEGIQNSTVVKTIKGKINDTFNKVKEKWNDFKNNTIVKTILGKVEPTFNKMKGKWNDFKNSKAVKYVNGVIQTGLQKANDVWHSLKDKTIKLGFDLKESWDSTKKRVQKWIDMIKNMLNGLIDKINSFLHIKWKAVKIAGKTIIPGFDKQLVHIPHLANGAVLKPNAPFLAMVGDQKRGTNIEAPLDTIKQGLREVQKEGSNFSNQDLLKAISNMQVNVFVQQDARGTFNMIKQEVVNEQRRTGKPAWT